MTSDRRSMPQQDPDAQALAEECAAVLWRNDPASKKLGMSIEKVAPGYAEISMPVADDMVNGHNICHGGFMFILADSTFAFACNTYNQNCVAQHCTISYLAPAFSGDTLYATGREVSKQGRNGIYDITIFNQKDEKIVEFRGFSRTIAGSLLSQDNSPQD